MPTPNTLASGGVGVVVLASGFEMPKSYAFHPQLVPINAREFESGADFSDVSKRVPPNTRMVFVAGQLPNTVFGTLRDVLMRRQVPLVQRNNATALEQALKAAMPVHVDKVVDAPSPHTDHMPTPEEEPPAMSDPSRARGAITSFVQAHVDLRKGSAEEARRLLPLVVAAGLQSTVGSLAQCISVLKRKGGHTETPRSIMTAQQRALSTLDEAIAGLTLVREYVADTEKLNVELQAKVATFKELARKLTED